MVIMVGNTVIIVGNTIVVNSPSAKPKKMPICGYKKVKSTNILIQFSSRIPH